MRLTMRCSEPLRASLSLGSLGRSLMSFRKLSAHCILLLCALCARLCISAEPAGVETTKTVTPEDIASTSKDGSPRFEEKLRFPLISLGHVHTEIIQVRNVAEN